VPCTCVGLSTAQAPLGPTAHKLNPAKTQLDQTCTWTHVQLCKSPTDQTSNSPKHPTPKHPTRQKAYLWETTTVVKQLSDRQRADAQQLPTSATRQYPGSTYNPPARALLCSLCMFPQKQPATQLTLIKPNIDKALCVRVFFLT